LKTEGQPIDSVLRLYTDAAAAHGEASDNGDYKTGNEQHKIIETVYRELRTRGPDAQLALLPLLAHVDSNVRCWAAAHALEFAPAEGEAALNELSLQGGLIGFGAETTLKEWRKGALRFP
jgi:hypothetical protein